VARSSALAHALCTRLVEGLQHGLADHGQLLRVATSRYDRRPDEDPARLLLERGVEGLLSGV